MPTQYERTHQKCEVFAKFPIGKKPVIENFVWNDRFYEVEEVTLVTKAKKGASSVWLISVATASGAYKLRFDADILQWWVEEITWEE